MSARTIMVQGTASNVGKSLLVTALCRLLRQDGWRVAPFKAQNMSNNSYITLDGREIGRAQGVQAEAAGIAATADMNPVLLKPSNDGASQVVIHGRAHATMNFGQYRREGFTLAAEAIRASLGRLMAAYDVVVIEGAGSAAEVNLKERELVNMRIAGWAGAPVLLAADIDRGGALAALVGTLALLSPDEQRRVRGLIINKFRGDRQLLAPALDFLQERTGKPVLGVMPYLDVELDAEDSQDLDHSSSARPADGSLRICALRLPRISNFTDLDPLSRSPGVTVSWVESPAALQDADAVVIPGSKNTAADLRWLWHNGLGAAVQRLAVRGVPVVGLCGGYQMLGSRLLDPEHHESGHAEVPGLELLDIETRFAPASAKITERTQVQVLTGRGWLAACAGQTVAGYEIHTGQTQLGPDAVPLFRAAGRPRAESVLGACGAEAQVWGTYLHGVFDNADLRRAWLGWLRRRRGLAPPGDDEGELVAAREATYDRLAAAARQHLDLPALYELLALERR